MAKTVKVYNGLVNNATTTIYTVPASRNAAVTLAAMASNNTDNSGIAFGGLTEIVFAAAGIAPCAANVGGNGLAMAASSGGTTVLAVFPQVTYLSTGQTVSVRAGASTTVRYSISVVEEY